ncbi:MAG: phosphatidylserine/phosphatidylglycerophosphate/cardiolipin synthase family protein [Myxococcota bacterium]|nr:phosphatidylserine/phosphatidylglycerophosphate/cardiolipin synthase family protein [Myxococcota bacterium]
MLPLLLSLLSAARADDCDAFAEPRIQHILNRRTSSRARSGNSARLLINGASSFRRRVESAEDAELIFVKTFIFADDDTGRAMVELLARRATEGATVILQYDIKGSLGSIGSLSELRENTDKGELLGDPEMMQRLRAAGVMVVPTNVPRTRRETTRFADVRADLPDGILRRRWALRNFNHFDHEKYWITGHREADGSLSIRAILGGMNIASEYAYGGTTQVDSVTGRSGWRDLDVEITGPVTNDIMRRYLQVLDFNLEQPLQVESAAWNPEQPETGEARIRFVWNQPALGNRRSIERLYRTLMRYTPEGSPIHIQSAYFSPGPRFIVSFIRALQRGRELVVVTNSAESIDVPLIPAASRYQYRLLMRADEDVSLYEWQHRPETGEATLHTKAAAFGHCGPIIIGSANLDGQSSEHNSESVVVIEDPELRKEFEAMFDIDTTPASATRITHDALTRGGPLSWLKQWGVYRVGWYFLSER